MNISALFHDYTLLPLIDGAMRRCDVSISA